MSPLVRATEDVLAIPQTAHLVGAGGAGMRSLSHELLRAGWQLTGSDMNLVPGDERPFPIAVGHAAENVPVICDLLIYSAAVPVDNPERRVAARRGIRETSYVEFLAALMRSRCGISIAGTHGKSSTSAMIATILKAAGHDPVAVFGAELRRQIKSDRRAAAQRSLCVVESCEYRQHFLQLRPQLVCLTGIEADHFDCYADVRAAAAAYSQFVDLLPADGVCLYNADDATATGVVHSRHIRTIPFGLQSADARWTARHIQRQGQEWELVHDGRSVGTVCWEEWGTHQVVNGIAAAATCAELGIATDTILSGLGQFPGLRRRLEQKGVQSGITYLDDYAHHPTAIRAVLSAVRTRWPRDRHKIWCIFQPHQVSRTLGLMAEFAEVLALSDETFILPIFAARESGSTEFVEVAQQLTLRVQQAGGTATFFPEIVALRANLQTAPRAGDVVVTLGAGDIDRIYHEFIRPVP